MVPKRLLFILLTCKLTTDMYYITLFVLCSGFSYPFILVWWLKLAIYWSSDQVLKFNKSWLPRRGKNIKSTPAREISRLPRRGILLLPSFGYYYLIEVVGIPRGAEVPRHHTRVFCLQLVVTTVQWTVLLFCFVLITKRLYEPEFFLIVFWH